MPGDKFIQYLVGLATREDRAALAHLRRGLGKPPGVAPEMYPYVVPWLPDDRRPDLQSAYYLVAALFATHPEHNGEMGGMGATFQRLRDNPNDSGVEHRFVALLNAHGDDLAGHLRHAVSLVRSRNVQINYQRMLTDLTQWSHPDRWVQRRWAEEFWKRTATESTSAAAATVEIDEAEKEKE